MRATSIDAEMDLIDFAKRAASKFAGNPRLWSYTDAEVEPGALLALRWGLCDDCVLVLKLDECHTPVVYGQAIQKP